MVSSQPRGYSIGLGIAETERKHGSLDSYILPGATHREPIGTSQQVGKVDAIMPLLRMWKQNLPEATANGRTDRVQIQAGSGYLFPTPPL